MQHLKPTMVGAVCLLYFDYTGGHHAFANRKHCFFIRLSIRLFVWTDIVSMIFHEQLSNLNEAYEEYSLVPTDDLVRFWRPKVKVTTGRQGDKGISVNTGVLKPII